MSYPTNEVQAYWYNAGREAANEDSKAMLANLTSVQARCTELIQEVRALRRGEGGATPEPDKAEKLPTAEEYLGQVEELAKARAYGRATGLEEAAVYIDSVAKRASSGRHKRDICITLATDIRLLLK